MLKIFLVEDEFVIREGIKNNIDWKANGYEFCGEASDGELAFPIIQKTKPDIVITDIRMPFMDGLELSRLIKKELPLTEIIILSGYEEFEYAKEAIKIGVSQYLCKPISGEELLKEINLLADKITEKRKEQEIKEKYIREVEENFIEEKRNFFQYLVTGTKSISELLEIAKKIHIDLSSIWYNIILLKIQSMTHAHDEYSGSMVKVEQKLKELDGGDHFAAFDRNLEGKALLVKADTEEELTRIQNDYIRKMKDLLGDYSHVRYFAGIGMPVNRLSELPGSFESASHAFAHRYLTRESGIWNYQDIEQKKHQIDDFNIGSVNAKELDRNKLRDFLKFGDKNEVVYFVEEYINDLGNNAMKSNMFRQYLVMDTYFCVVDFVVDLQFSKDEIEVFSADSEILQNNENSMKYMERIISKALELREKSASNRYGDIVDEVMKYIEEHYAQEDLSLNILASHVNFSPNHLSMVLSQQTGQTFIKYLTDFRMNKAKELLRCTGKRSSEIGLEVGYKDPHYFSFLFKKTQGMTPTQYRGLKSAEGEG